MLLLLLLLLLKGLLPFEPRPRTHSLLRITHLFLLLLLERLIPLESWPRTHPLLWGLNGGCGLRAKPF